MKRALAALLFAGCAPALQRGTSIEDLVAPPVPGADAASLSARAEAAFALRADPDEARAASELSLQAAAADRRAVEPLVLAARALSFRLERAKGAEREELAGRGVRACQVCRSRAPADGRCAYRLAVALGQQARERPSTAASALPVIVELLREAIATDPRQDEGGPHRVLALLLLRAPGWPLGPGDAEAALPEAREAVQLSPAWPPNLLALCEALARNEAPEQARQACAEAAAQAGRPPAALDPDAPRWVEESKRLLQR